MYLLSNWMISIIESKAILLSYTLLVVKKPKYILKYKTFTLLYIFHIFFTEPLHENLVRVTSLSRKNKVKKGIKHMLSPRKEN